MREKWLVCGVGWNCWMALCKARCWRDEGAEMVVERQSGCGWQCVQGQPPLCIAPRSAGGAPGLFLGCSPAACGGYAMLVVRHPSQSAWVGAIHRTFHTLPSRLSQVGLVVPDMPGVNRNDEPDCELRTECCMRRNAVGLLGSARSARFLTSAHSCIGPVCQTPPLSP